MALSTLMLPLLLLLLLPPAFRDYLSLGRPRLSSKDVGVGSEVHPLILLPGMACSDLEARLTEAYQPSEPRCGAMKGKGWFPLWKNVSHLTGHQYVDCFLGQMSLVYDPVINEYRNQPGVETRIPNFGSIRAFSYKNPLNTDLCIAKLKARLEDMGYRDRDTMFGAPYDFRYAPPSPGQTSEVYSRYFKEFMKLVEAATERKQKKAVIFGHSFGGLVALEFVRNTPLAWRNKYVHHLILVAPTIPAGFLEPVSNIASGTKMLFVPTTTPLTTRALWRSFESAISNFPSPDVFGGRPLVVTRERNYSAHDMESFLAAVGFGEAVEPFRRRAVPRMKMNSFVAPMVPMTYINGVGIRTPLRLVYSDDNFDASPEEAAYGDGDGKIHLMSMLLFEKEMRRQPGQGKHFRSIKINNAQHSKIVADDFALDRVIQEIVKVSNQQIPS